LVPQIRGGTGRRRVSKQERMNKQERPSFLKKRSKKLLSIAQRSGPPLRRSVWPATDKSFLLLFFKKEDLPYLPLA
jgi:hypothetical protein